jgi:hypothetical protein
MVAIDRKFIVKRYSMIIFFLAQNLAGSRPQAAGSDAPAADGRPGGQPAAHRAASRPPAPRLPPGPGLLRPGGAGGGRRQHQPRHGVDAGRGAAEQRPAATAAG